MTDEPTADRRGVASHLKMAGLLAGGLAVGYALVQERERVGGAVANVQNTLTNNGLTMMQTISEMTNTFLARVHETFVAAAPPSNLDVVVRNGLTCQSAPPVSQECLKAPRTRQREVEPNSGDENTDNSADQPEASHPKRRTRHTSREHNAIPSQHCSSRVVGTAAQSGWQASRQAQEASEDSLVVVRNHSDEAVATTQPTTVAMGSTGDESNVMVATAVSPLPSTNEAEDTPPDNTPSAAAIVVNDIHVQVAFDTLVSTQTTSITQRAQAEPASLLGARLSATWVNETFACEVVMIREGKGNRFEALVKYDTDGVEQWEVIGELPYKHTLIAEPADTWLRTGSVLIGAHTLEHIDCREFEGVVMAWLPKRDGYESLYKIYHIADGDFEELDDTEVKTAIALHTERTNGKITKE